MNLSLAGQAVGVTRVKQVGAMKKGGQGAKLQGKVLGPRPVLWLRMHLPRSCLTLII